MLIYVLLELYVSVCTLNFTTNPPLSYIETMHNDPSSPIDEAQRLLSEASIQSLTREQQQEMSLQLAAAILKKARRIETAKDKKRRILLAKMLEDPQGKQFTVRLADQSFRSHNPARAANQISWLLKTHGVPAFLPFFQRLLLHLFPYLSKFFPNLTVSWMKKMIRKEASPMIKFEETLSSHLHQRHQAKIQLNLNHVGEAILGEEEAQKRVETYLRDLADPQVECISIKISSSIVKSIFWLGKNRCTPWKKGSKNSIASPVLITTTFSMAHAPPNWSRWIWKSTETCI